jgi:hypothetical protein
LAKDVDSGDNVLPLVRHKVYDSPTLCDVFSAGQALIGAMEHAEHEHD